MKRVLNHAVSQEQQTQGFQVLQNSVGSAHRKIASGKKYLNIGKMAKPKRLN